MIGNSLEPAARDRFSGKTAVIAGASKGIGRAIATALAREGASVIVNARRPESLEEMEASLRSEGLAVIAHAGSVLDEGVPEALVDSAVQNFGGIDLVVNAVGINTFVGPLLDVPERKFNRTITGNTWPTVALVQAAVQRGLGNGGAVLALSSIGARQVQPVLAPYSAAKAALELLVASLARELGPQGIRINAIAPGLVRTDMSRTLWEGEHGALEAGLLPLQRLGEPEDIAQAAAFLLSGESGWITGVTLDVDGGRLIVGQEPREMIGRYPAVAPAS